ncbi:hypothetical protein AB0I10_41200 [Streptomyces sp. NPDC050636]|uniref:hypothetical protein n=1 Tax=Streptomyces sp. NPDC050636 TaxID=3154510 RepID=UPI003443A1CD
MRTHRIAATAVAAASIALLGGTGQAFADNHTSAQASAPRAAAGAVSEPAAKLTVSGYLTYLKARQTLKALPKAKQAKFVTYLLDRDIYLALANTVKGSIGRPAHITDPYHEGVTFVTDIATRTGKDKLRTTSLTFTVTERIYDIPVTSKTLALRFQAAKGGSKKVVADAKVTNVNAAIAIKGGPTATSLDHGIGHASTTWHAVPRVKSFGKHVAKRQKAWAGQGYWSASLSEGK